MRTLRSGCISLLLTGMLALPLSPAAAATDANPKTDYYSPEQNEFLTALRQLSDDFQAEYPEYLDLSDDREVLDRRAELARIWMDRVQALRDEYDLTPTVAAEAPTDAWREARGADAAGVLANPPNELADLGSAEEAMNAGFSYHEIIAAEVYGVWTKHFGGFGIPPTQVWYGGTPAAGSDGPWVVTGGINAQVLPVLLPEAWNPSMAAVPQLPPVFDAYYMAMTEWAAPALVIGAPSAILATTSLGSGLPVHTGTGPAPIIQGGPSNWVDYPYLVVDDVPGNPGPPGFGDVHIAWVEYVEGGDGDADGNGIFYDDPADGFIIWAATANTAIGPSPYPNFMIWPVHPRPSVQPQAHQAHRPSLSVVGPAGTLPLGTGLPPHTVFLAYVDFLSSSVIIDANTSPGLGTPWGVFGPFSVAPVVLLPPVLNGGVKAASTATIAVDNGPLFTGQVYIAWADYSLGDADIFFSFSASGGTTWSPPFRVNQDPPGNGADQWAPHMVVDPMRGTISITYYDRRMDPGNVAIETWVSSSINGGFGWADSLVSDPGPVAPVTSLNVGGWRYFGDYHTSVFNPVSGWGAIWNDGRNGNDQDVYFVNL